MSKYEEKKQARIDHYLELAAKREQESDALYQQSHKMLEAIPLGQPLLVDHYSYKSDLNYRNRAWNKMDKSMETGKKAAYYADKAAAAESNTAISSDDPEAIDKLKERLADLEDSHDLMKRVNAHYRKQGTCRGCEGISDELADKVEEGIQSHSWDKAPFPAYALTNSSAVSVSAFKCWSGYGTQTMWAGSLKVAGRRSTGRATVYSFSLTASPPRSSASSSKARAFAGRPARGRGSAN